VLKRIHNASEQHLEHLKLKVENLRISELEGENVDVAVSLVNAAHSIFISSSTATQSRIPPEWSKTLIRVFQTTTVPEFNQVFKDEEREARRDADKNGGQPSWPTHEQLTRLATVTYNRIKQSGSWDLPTKKSKGYLNAPAGKGPPSNPDYRCWNCGEPGHRLDACPKPRNQARIDAERVKFRAKRGGKRDGTRRSRKPQAKAAAENTPPSDSSPQKKKKKRSKKSKADRALPARDNPESRPQAAPAQAPRPESSAGDLNRLYDPYTVQSILHELL
jgi:Zinc knuckle